MEEDVEKLKKMVNKPFLYNNEEVVILGYCDNTGSDGDEVEIYLNNGKTIECRMVELYRKLPQFRPITNTVIVLAEQRMNQVSTVNPTVLGNLRDTILNQIERVKEDPKNANQAKQVFQGVNTLLNLAKTELEYRKFIQSTDHQNE